MEIHQKPSRQKSSLLKFKSSLSRIFFTSDAPINRFSEEYENFWVFLPRYEQKFKEGKFCVEHLTNVTCWDRPPSELLERLGVVDQDRESVLTEDTVEFVKNALMAYMAFLAKQTERKAMNLKKFQDQLPISGEKDTLMTVLRLHQVVLVAGDTGCGKSTQVPRYLLEHGFKNIIVTQPRRIAAVALATRVSYEVGCELGSVVGFHIRFQRKTSKETKLTFMTEGLFLRMLASAASSMIEKASSAVCEATISSTEHQKVCFTLFKKGSSIPVHWKDFCVFLDKLYKGLLYQSENRGNSTEESKFIQNAKYKRRMLDSMAGSIILMCISKWLQRAPQSRPGINHTRVASLNPRLGLIQETDRLSISALVKHDVRASIVCGHSATR